MKNKRWKRQAKKMKAECSKPKFCTDCKYDKKCDELCIEFGMNNIIEFLSIRKVEKLLKNYNILFKNK
jgi:hypothetical protein